MNIVADYIFDFKHKHGDNWIDELREDERMRPLIVNVYRNYMIVKYRSLIDAYEDPQFWDKNDQFYQYCRSLVVDYENENVVLWPYKKFFNINEREESSYDAVMSRMNAANHIYFTKKLDGSYIAATYYNDDIVVSSSSGIDPETNWYVEHAYEYIHWHLNVREMIEEGEGFTFIFEMIDPQDIHVVDYSNAESGLYLTGIVNSEDGIELNPEQVIELAEMYGVLHTDIVKDNLDHILSTLGDVPANEAEGFVMYINGFRVKIKYDSYVQLHHALATIKSPKATVEAIKHGYYDDFISKIPAAYHDIIRGYANNVFNYCDNAASSSEEYLAEVKNALGDNYSNRKDAMIYITNNVPKDYQPFVRNLYLGRTNDYIKSYKY